MAKEKANWTQRTWSILSGIFLSIFTVLGVVMKVFKKSSRGKENKENQET
ncbi:hypothetical protein BGP_3217 [Beggiatoa sp. PS]|nr:hypothetical protein BGP_3217 [Beggiatoa sp. PS]